MQSIGCRAAAPPECLLHLLLWWIKPEPGVRAFFRLMKISVCRAAAVRRLRGARSGAHGLVAVTGRAADSRRPTSSRARPAPGCRRSRRNAGRVAALRAAARRASSRAARGRPRCACRAPPVSRRSSCRRREPVTRPKSAMSWRGAASVVFFHRISGVGGGRRAAHAAGDCHDARMSAARTSDRSETTGRDRRAATAGRALRAGISISLTSACHFLYNSGLFRIHAHGKRTGRACTAP